MASEIHEQIMAERPQIADEAESLFTVSRAVTGDGPASLKHTIPKEAQQVIGIEDGDQVQIDIFQNGYVVRLEGADEC